MKNAYAAKLQAQRVTIKNVERAALVHRVADMIGKAYAVELNDEFGFGRDRIKKVQNGVDSIIIECEALANGVDWGYADGKLDERYKKIMGGDEYFTE